MFGIKDNTNTTRTQLNNNSIIDEVIESKIKACQRENGRLMTRTSQRLREQYGVEMVDRVVNRLSRRRQRGNQYQKNESNEIMSLISSLTTNKVNQETYSL
jgi:hypothetical protein